MTGQTTDRFRYKEETFALLYETSPVLFSPTEYGILPAASTANWRGYLCEYEIKDGKLYLQRLYVRDHSNAYPAIHGVTSQSLPSSGTFGFSGQRLYDYLRLCIDFTGPSQ